MGGHGLLDSVGDGAADEVRDQADVRIVVTDRLHAKQQLQHHDLADQVGGLGIEVDAVWGVHLKKGKWA